VCFCHGYGDWGLDAWLKVKLNYIDSLVLK